MRHKLGNGPKCIECFWYREKEPGDKAPHEFDGWCVNEYQCSHGINGRKREMDRIGILLLCILIGVAVTVIGAVLYHDWRK